eukprot:m.249213 g.249213  ORF g.249213 m.249213 type:complete len:83 (-) comp16140_c1_seq10:2399-2647(-)
MPPSDPWSNDIPEMEVRGSCLSMGIPVILRRCLLHDPSSSSDSSSSCLRLNHQMTNSRGQQQHSKKNKHSNTIINAATSLCQ